MNGLFTEKEIVAKLGKYSCIALAALDNKANGLHQLGSYGIHCQSVSPYNNSFELLIKDLKRYKKNGYRVILLSGSRTRAKRLSEDITDQGITCFYTENYDHELFEGRRGIQGIPGMKNRREALEKRSASRRFFVIFSAEHR